MNKYMRVILYQIVTINIIYLMINVLQHATNTDTIKSKCNLYVCIKCINIFMNIFTTTQSEEKNIS